MEIGSIQTLLPAELEGELRKMRRNPAEYAIGSRHKCRFCAESKVAYHLINVKFDNRLAGSWCPVHGWLFFDSVGLPPTERLTTSEIEDNRIAEQRRRKAVAK